MTEVKSSEEWEKTKMTIYDMGLERGIEQERCEGIRKLIEKYNLSQEEAENYME